MFAQVRFEESKYEFRAVCRPEVFAILNAPSAILVLIVVVPDPVTTPVSEMDWLAVKNDEVAVAQSLI